VWERGKKKKIGHEAELKKNQGDGKWDGWVEMVERGKG